MALRAIWQFTDWEVQARMVHGHQLRLLDCLVCKLAYIALKSMFYLLIENNVLLHDNLLILIKSYNLLQTVKLHLLVRID